MAYRIARDLGRSNRERFVQASCERTVEIAKKSDAIFLAVLLPHDTQTRCHYAGEYLAYKDAADMAALVK